MAELVGKYLRNYHIIRLIGSGAYADVYQGIHLYLKTPVAIKILHGGADRQLLEKFLAGPRQYSQLTHPHIIHVLDVGMKDDLSYLAMDYAPGGNIRQLHPEGTIVSLSTVIMYVKDLADALQYAHDQQCVHGNLKPENVVLGSHYELLLSDFGLTPLLPNLEYSRPLPYFAPEMLHKPALPASDQYALAVMVYELLSGQSVAEGIIMEGALANRSDRPPFKLPVSLRERMPEISPGVERVLLKALSAEPEQRYPNIRSFAEAFEEEAGMRHSTVPVISVGTPSSNTVALQAPRTASLPVQNLQMPLMSLLGREHDLQAVHARLSRPEVRLLTLIGPPGIGKTRLAQEFGARIQDEFAQGICFVPLVPIRDPELVIPAIARALGLREDHAAPPFERITSFLGEQQILLILDNFEQLLLAGTQLTALLTACPNLKLLVTSRAALHVQSEYEFVVRPLAVPDLKELPTLDALARVPSVALFIQRVEAFNSAFQLTEGNAASIAGICAYLEGVPLAIELAATRSKLLSFQTLFSRLMHGGVLLSGERQDVPSHQQTLYATVYWSYDLLTPEEQALFRLLCIFVGDFTLEAVEAVAKSHEGFSQPVLEYVGSLVDKSLLQLHEEEGQEPQLHLLAQVREFGLERLEASGELEHCYEASAAYYLALCEQAEDALNSSLQGQWLKRLEQEHENIWDALRWLLRRRHTESAARIVSALRQFWFLGGYLGEGRRFLEQVLAILDEDVTNATRHLRARTLLTAGYLAFRQHDPRFAFDSLKECLELFQRLEDPQGLADCLLWLGIVMYVLGQINDGLRLVEESRALFLQMGDLRSYANALLHLGISALFRSQFDQARQQLEECQELYSSLAEVWEQAITTHYLGFIAYAQEDYVRARIYFETSLEALRKLGLPFGSSEVMTILAYDLVALGEPVTARKLLREALTLAREKENVEDEARVLCGIGHLALRQGKPAKGRSFFEKALTKMQGRALVPRSKWFLASCLEGLGEIALSQRRPGQTVYCLAAGQTVRSANGYFSSIGIEPSTYIRVQEEAQKQLGEQEFVAAWEVGLAMTPEQALELFSHEPPAHEALIQETQPGRGKPEQSEESSPLQVFPNRLTAREKEVLHFLAKGLTNNQIAGKLVLSLYTVNRHVQSIYGKLGVNSRSGATRYAIEHQLV